MMKNILAWLFAFFYTPVPNKVIQPPEVETMSDQPVEVPVTSLNETVVVSSTPNSTLLYGKAGVADFEKALEFVESGVAKLGEAAKDELKELAKKYL